MPLGPGSTLLHYRLIEPIGEGGMGVVWRATDTTLGRDVALKLMLDVFASDAERLARFEREARTLASLSHPNVAAVHGLHEADGVRFLVMELVDGEDLAERLARGPMPLEEALPAARQIAEGLEAAHARGIVHRDLKPANVKLTEGGRVKVLDFGLAKPTDIFATGSGTSPTMSPTITSGGTAAGTILGTAAYMSPEQARGKTVDQRTDVWAFGCLLYEMLTGRRAFFGETVSDTLAAVLRGEPDMNALPAQTPASVRRVIRRSLEKDPERRLHDLADARIEIVEAQEGAGEIDGSASGAAATPSHATPGRLPRRWLAPVAVLLVAGAALALGYRMHRPPAPHSWHVAIPGAGFNSGSTSAISPDGKWIAYSPPTLVLRSPIVLRATDSFEERQVTGVSGGANPSFSPDSKWLAFSGDRGMYRVPVSGGTPQRVIETSGYGSGGVWAPGDELIIEDVRIGDSFWTGLTAVPSSGGAPRKLTAIAEGERFHLQAHLLPDGKTLLFTVNNVDNTFSIGAVPVAGGSHRILLRDASTPLYLPTGHLLYFRPGTGEVAAVRFDAERAEPIGEPVNVLTGVLRGTAGQGAYDVASDGTLIYTAADMSMGAIGSSRPVWVDRGGKVSPLVDEVSVWGQPRLSPDGTKLLLRKPQTPNCDLWVRDVARGTMSRVTFEGDNHDPVWGPGRDRISFAIQNERSRLIASKAWDGTGTIETIVQADDSLSAPSWSADGNVLAFVWEAATSSDIWVKPGVGEATPFLTSEFEEIWPAVSPDGRWIAYVSNESGREEVYVRPYPGPGGRLQISTAGGTGPLWSKDGGELFYAEADKMMRVAIRTTPTLDASPPEMLFTGRFGWSRPGNYDITADGTRFVMTQMESELRAPDLRLVTNWLETIRAKLP